MKKIFLMFILIISMISNAKILTSNQLTYTLTKNITKNTDIEVISALDAYSDMFNQKSTFKNLDNKDKIFDNVDVVVTLNNILKNDFLYEQARRYNIKVVDIDLSYSYRDDSSLVLLKKSNDSGDILTNIWLDFSNLYKMIDILSLDLITLYPEYRETILKNSNDLKNVFFDLSNNFIEKMSNSNSDLSVIQIGEEKLNYFLDSLEIYYQNIPENANLDLIKKTIKETGIKKVVSSKTLSSKMKKDLESLGIKYEKLEIGNIPIDDDFDDEMDVNGFIEILKNNINKLEKLLLN